MVNRIFGSLPLVVYLSVMSSVAHGQGQVAPAPLKVGVVDLAKVVDGFQKRKDREAELNKIREAAANQLKELQKKVEGLSAEMELLDKSSPDFMAKKKLLAEKQEELLVKTRLADREIGEKLEQYLQEVYSEILARIDEYRAQNNYDFIIRVDKRPLTTQEPIVTQLDRKVILSHAITFDITDKVIAFLNQAYTKK